MFFLKQKIPCGLYKTSDNNNNRTAQGCKFYKNFKLKIVNFKY